MHCHPHNRTFELLNEHDHDCHCEHDDYPVCGHVHKISGTNIQFEVGDFIYWNGTAYVPAIENHCDLMVTRVNRSKTWFEAANQGEFELKNHILKGQLFINASGELTNTETNTKVGFIDGGHLYLLIEKSGSSGSSGSQVNSDWNANSGVAEILNKPNIPAAQVNSDWNANSGIAQILNKPNIPEIPTASSTATRIALLGYDELGALKVWYFNISPEVPTSTPDGSTFATAVVGN